VTPLPGKPSEAVQIAYLRDALALLTHTLDEFLVNAEYVVEGHYEEELVDARDDAVTLLTGEVPDA
jgi:hypothetical protein